MAPQTRSPEQLVDDLLGTRLADLGEGVFRSRVQELRAWLDHLEGMIGMAQALGGATAKARRGRGHPPKHAASPPTTEKARGRKRGRRRGRSKGGVGEFAATAFIQNAVQDSGKAGVTAPEVIKQVKKAAPGKHVSPSALVHTILRRLKNKGSLTKKAGKWYPVSK